MKAPHNHHGIIVIPTGAGKSLCIAAIVKELGEPTVIFQPSREILEQNYDKLLSYGYSASIYSASLGRKEISNITFATIGSAINNWNAFRNFRYIIVDECHYVNSKEKSDGSSGMYKRFFEALENIKILGLTATPYRLASNSFGAELRFLTRTKPRIFNGVIHYVQNKTLFDSGHLANIKYFPVHGFQRSALKVNSTGADFDDRSLKLYYNSIHFKEKLVKAVNRLVEIGRKNVLVFTRFIEESEYVCKMVPEAVIVTGETKGPERKRILTDFRSGKIKVVTNCNVLAVGFDFPQLETVVLACPTMSLARYYQWIGRGIRPHPDKDHCMVVDMCDNISLFGHIEDIKLELNEKSLWIVTSLGKQLTNVPFHRPGFQQSNSFLRRHETV